MAKPTTEMKLRKEYKAMGYKVDNKKYVCPTCAATFARIKNNNKARTIWPNLFKAFAMCVLVFRKEGCPSIAACPKCGLRRSDKHTTVVKTEDNGLCHGKTTKNKPCKHKAQSNGYCAQHQDQATTTPPEQGTYEGQGRAAEHLRY